LVSTRIFGCLTRLSGTWRFSRIWETSRPCQFLRWRGGNSLLQSADVVSPNQNFAQAIFSWQHGHIGLQRLQIQFQRRLSHGLQALASYSWSHSIDTGSSGSLNGPSSLPGPGINPNQNRGPSDFDIRQAFSAAVTYDVPVPKLDRLTRTILGGWSLQNIVQVTPPHRLTWMTDCFL